MTLIELLNSLKLFMKDNISFIFISILLLTSIMLSSCEDNKAVPKSGKDTLSSEILPDQICWNMEVLFVDSSYTKAVLKAKRARIYQIREETLLDGGLILEFISKKTGKIESILTADSARIDDRTKNMLARGNVIVRADDNRRRLETSLLMWDNKTQKLYSTEFVKINTPDENLQGYGFESDQNLNNYKFLKVSGEQK